MKHQLLDRQRTVAAAPPPTRPPAARAAWSPWATTARPCTTREEREFVRTLADSVGLGGDPFELPFERPDVTLLLNALRCGLPVHRLAALAPGMDPSRLLGAYVTLERERSRAAEAWRAIVAAGTHRGQPLPGGGPACAAALEHYGPDAAKLLPASISRLAGTAGARQASLPAALHKMAVGVAVQAAHVRRIEAAIEHHADDETFSAELGALLYDPFGDAVANRSDFLADRIGLLNPPRVAALLGERPAL